MAGARQHAGGWFPGKFKPTATGLARHLPLPPIVIGIAIGIGIDSEFDCDPEPDEKTIPCRNDAV